MRQAQQDYACEHPDRLDGSIVRDLAFSTDILVGTSIDFDFLADTDK